MHHVVLFLAPLTNHEIKQAIPNIPTPFLEVTDNTATFRRMRFRVRGSRAMQNRVELTVRQYTLPKRPEAVTLAVGEEDKAAEDVEAKR